MVLNVPDTYMRCVLERFHNDLKYLNVPNKTLKSEGFFRSNKVYVEYSGDLEEDVPFQDSRFFKLLDRYQNTIRVHVNLPSVEDVEEFLKSSLRHNKLLKQAVIESVISDNDKVKFQLGNDSLEVDEGISDRGSESELELKFKSMSLPKSYSDPSIYHRYSTSTDDVELIVPTSRTNSPLQGQSSSSQDTSTSAEFSLPTNGSTSLDGQVEDPQSVDDTLGNKDSDSEQTSPPSPIEGAKDLDFSKQGAKEDWDAEIEAENDVNIRNNDNEEPLRRYFNVIHEEVDNLTKQRQLTVLVDKRITLGAFKTELEPFVYTTSDNFKVYRVYSNNQEFESIRLSETLSFFEDGKLNIKLGRALKPGEYRVKVYQLLLNESEPSKFLIETIFAKGMSVLESKKMILPEIKEQCSLDFPLERCRLRKKTWKNPGTVYVDSQLYEEDVPIFANWEVFLQVLDGPEKMTCNSYLAIFVRRWRPSCFSIDPFQEIILTQQTVDELKQKLAEVSGIPEENIEYAKGRGTFPCDVSLLEIHTDLDWSPYVTTLNTWPLYICDDGNVLYYRDKSEKLMELSDERKKELQQKENARLSRGTYKSSYSPRKERALKIYTDDLPPSSSSKSSPDLD
ncbi:hypothetical protein KUTeg_007288 [Tegillarca granosa]|uniref:Ubiquitin carboxyl-terminal hydrolase 47 C-terminal domain-containing protein n=1 Tax=Tegillarca granosa TaxID=220873 RepID=A0ABQ9FCU1_TEGGR|nr:hypothetical protein KUTeg_007288 [Tegillarca granosa]